MQYPYVIVDETQSANMLLVPTCLDEDSIAVPRGIRSLSESPFTFGY
jgi:hypothetical protein